MSNDQHVITAYLRAELAAAHNAIRAIWHVNLAIIQDHADGADLDDVIAEATRCLPPELRTPDMPPLVDHKTTEKMQAVRQRAAKKNLLIEDKECGFDDILG